ncbi:MAG: hypothetical protein HY763_13230 [Planctomycetes bacterium]|nr:hypothetical protein [Planctomycetota bacterium]
MPSVFGRSISRVSCCCGVWVIGLVGALWTPLASAQQCSPTPDGRDCVGPCSLPGEACEPREIMTDAQGHFLAVTCCDCVQGGCHIDYDPASQQLFCVSATPCPNATEQCQLVGKGNLDGTITYSCDCIDSATPPPCEWTVETNQTCAPGQVLQHCSGPCPPGTQPACLPQSVTVPPPPQPGPPPVVCDCVEPGTDPCRIVVDSLGPHCIGVCPVGSGPCARVDTPNPDGSTTYSCSCNPQPGVCEPDPTGTACTSQCQNPNQVCNPKEILADPLGNFIGITCCECEDLDLNGTPTCHLDYNQQTGQISCVDPCPDPNKLCTRVGKGNLDGTITYTCECLGAQDPAKCDFISECNPCTGGTCTKHCSGPCPPPYDACMPDSLVLLPDGTWAADCGCGEPSSDTCRPILVDPATGTVDCQPPCGPIPCPPPVITQQADGSTKYTCPPCAPELGACCISQGPGGSSYCVEITFAQCQSALGLWMGAGTLCINVTCPEPTGACCVYDECDGYSCSIETFTDCDNMGGIYQGNNTTCNPDPCPPKVGACCVPDGPPPSGFVCMITTARDCNDLFGYYHGDGTLCNPNPCEDPAASCGVADCCQRPPQFTDPAYAGFTGPVAVVTSQDWFATERVWVIDVDNKASAPLNTHWTGAARYSAPGWDTATLGSVFGVTLDRQGNIYVTASTSFPLDTFGGGGPGAVYKIDRLSGAVTTFATLPNTGPALGNIAYDCVCRQFFVTNFEDGKIYRINAAGTVVSSYDHGVPDGGSAGFAPLGDRPWGVHVYRGRVYYGIWTEDIRVDSLANNTVWSIPLKGCEFDPQASPTLEVTLPNVPSTWGAYESMPASDFAFSTDGCMLIGERTMSDDTNPGAHVSQVLEYRWNGSSWVPSGHTFDIGYLFGGITTNSAGGVDYEVDGSVWATGDALQFGPQYVYGIQNIPGSGGTVFQSIIIDVDGNYLSPDKFLIGDVEIPCLPCARPPANLTAWWPLDELSPATSVDIVNANNGTWTNGPVPIPGEVNNALRFDGTNDFVAVPDNNTLDINSSCLFFGPCTPEDLSIDAWVRTCENTGVRPIVDKMFTQSWFFWTLTRGYSFYLNNGVLELSLGDQALFFGGGVSTYPDSSATNLADGNWHHVAVSVNRDQSAGSGTFYIDGVAVSTFNPTPRFRSLANAGGLRIASRTVPATNFFVDDIDEVQIFRRAITAAEVDRIYRARNSGKCKDICHVPVGTAYCLNQSSKVVNMTLCNYSAGAHTYAWSVTGLPVGPGCTVSGLTATFTPSSGTVAIPAGQCVNIPVTITAPVGLTPGQTACYQFTSTNIQTGNGTLCSGKLSRTNLWCLDWVDIDDPILKVASGTAKTASVSVSNEGDPDGSVMLQLSAIDSETGEPSQAVSLNGLPPGEPVIDTVMLQPGQSTNYTVDVSARGHAFAQFFDVEVIILGATGRDVEGGTDAVESIGVLTLPGFGATAPALAPAPHDAPKNRYISFTPNNGTVPVAFLASLDAPSATPIGWVGLPDAQGISKLSATPVYRVWPEPVVHLGDCPIFPVAAYEISATVDGVLFSDPVFLYTILQPSPKLWGDTVGVFDTNTNQWTPPNTTVNVNDFVAALQKFQGLPQAPHVTVVDVVGAGLPGQEACLNKSGNIGDVFNIIKAFQGAAYPFTTNPLTCPTCP